MSFSCLQLSKSILGMRLIFTFAYTIHTNKYASEPILDVNGLLISEQSLATILQEEIGISSTGNWHPAATPNCKSGIDAPCCFIYIISSYDDDDRTQGADAATRPVRN